jgi:hypothetical protein
LSAITEMVGAQLSDRKCLEERSQPAILYCNAPEFESLAQSNALPIKGFDYEGRTTVKMVVESLVQSAFASHGSSDVCDSALRIVDYIDALQMRDG